MPINVVPLFEDDEWMTDTSSVLDRAIVTAYESDHNQSNEYDVFSISYVLQDSITPEKFKTKLKKGLTEHLKSIFSEVSVETEINETSPDDSINVAVAVKAEGDANWTDLAYLVETRDNKLTRLRKYINA